MASSLSKQVADAQAEIATWTPEQRARVQLEGRSDRNNVAAQAGDETAALAKQLATWRAEVARLNDLIAHASGVQAGDDPMRELPESWRTSDISWICSQLKENTIFDVDRLQREWDEMKALAIQAQVSPRATADVERVTITPALRRAVDMTRADLGESGSNYPAVRELLAFAESHIATTKPGA